LKRVKLEFFVKSTEQIPCPCCGGKLKVIGSRKRRYHKKAGELIELIIRRLRCSKCNKIHHELPDNLIPYKRYDSESIQAVVAHNDNLDVAVDNSTITRWRRWFKAMSPHFIGCLISVVARYEKETVIDLSTLPESVLGRIFYFVGSNDFWLARVVRTVANLNNWQHTRSACMS
jgi:hypothetical protein